MLTSWGQKGIAKEDIIKVKAIVEKNGWDSNGMHLLSIDISVTQ